MQNRILKQNIQAFPREYLMLRFNYFSREILINFKIINLCRSVSWITQIQYRTRSEECFFYFSQSQVLNPHCHINNHQPHKPGHAFLHYSTTTTTTTTTTIQTFKTCKLNSNWVWSSLKRKRTNKNTSGIRILFLFSFLKHCWLQLTLTKITQEVQLEHNWNTPGRRSEQNYKILHKS